MVNEFALQGIVSAFLVIGGVRQCLMGGIRPARCCIIQSKVDWPMWVKYFSFPAPQV